MRPRAWWFGPFLLLACGGEESPGPERGFDCEAPAEEGLLVGTGCPRAVARLSPRVRIDGAWLGRDAPCEAVGEAVRCPAGDAGTVEAVLDGDLVRVRFTAASPVVVEALAVEGPASVEGARAWLSNGFQSWSQSGAVALGGPIDDASLDEALAARGDAEVVREGHELSWTYTVVGGAGPALVAGAVSAGRLHPWARAFRDEDAGLRLTLASGGAGERVAVAAGETIEGEPFFVRAGEAAAPLLRAYADAVPSRRRAHPVETEAGWNSWYELWDAVDEEAVRDNAALARSLLEPRVPGGTPLRIVVDDGWQRAWGDWEPNEKFPSGLDGLAADLSADGFRVGVWLAPLLVAEDARVAADHPEWLVEGVEYRHLKNGPMRVLDVTHPEAAAHLADVIGRIVSWGYDLLKIDFLFAGTWEGGRHEEVTGMEAYARALSIIREAAGEDAILLAVGAPGLASLPHVDQWRVGGDIALENFGAAWPFVPNQARSIGARVPLCLATLCDPDPVLLRDLGREEVETGAWVVAMGGGALFLSDDLRALDASRADWALDERRVALSLSAEPAIPDELLPEDAPARLPSALSDQLGRGGRSTHVIPRTWRMQDGTRVAVNVGEEPAEIGGVEVPARATRVAP